MSLASDFRLEFTYSEVSAGLKNKKSKVSGPKIGAVQSENAMFSLEAELDSKWLLWSIYSLIRPSLNKILTDNLVTCPNKGNYFAFFQCTICYDQFEHFSDQYKFAEKLSQKPLFSRFGI